IGAEGSKAKVEELLRSLMGSVFEDEEEKPIEERGQGWMAEEGDLVGWPREELLREVVLILVVGKHRDLQRITVPYARLLGILDGASDSLASSAMEI
ncbi:hypothetical protein KCU73_g14148, partial [Aureobasidium melanogenum]